jgi:cytidylate kinase
MGVVTLTGHLGSIGVMDQLVAQRLGYRLAGRELVLESAEALGWPEERVDEFDERTGGLGRRLTELMERWAAQQANFGSMISAYSMPYGDAVLAARPEDEQYIEALKSVMTSLADEGDVVLVGRGGQALFADRPHTVHVRVVCPIEERTRRIAFRNNISESEARSLIEHSDSQREAWHRKYFGIDYRSPYHYSLVVNTGRMSFAFAADLVVELARAHV